LFPESETKFFAKAVELEITFVKEDTGPVTHLLVGGARQAKKAK
jgi:hypothetical protein